MEKQEWEYMEAAILAAEAQLESANKEANDPGIASNVLALQLAFKRLHDAEAEVERLYARWAALEAKQQG
jgi:ATP-binding cassette subfamily F protein uup